MSLSRCQFEILTFLEKNGAQVCNLRLLSQILKISGTMIEKDIEYLCSAALIKKDGDELSITDKGLESLEPYRVKRAVIMAAGFGSRMVPITLERPKPLVKINGVRIIDTLIDALVRAEVKEIIIVRGYKKEMFDELLEKYPFITLADNDVFRVLRVDVKLQNGFCFLTFNTLAVPVLPEHIKNLTPCITEHFLAAGIIDRIIQTDNERSECRFTEYPSFISGVQRF